MYVFRVRTRKYIKIAQACKIKFIIKLHDVILNTFIFLSCK